MATRSAYSIVESPRFPDLGLCLGERNIEEIKFNSMRKALVQIKKQVPDFIFVEFFYGFGNNYAGVNISNLDVMLYSLQKYAPKTQVIVFVEKGELQYVDKLRDIFPLKAVFTYPLNVQQIAECLE